MTEVEQAILDKWVSRLTSDHPKNEEYKVPDHIAHAIGMYLYFGIFPGYTFESWLSKDFSGVMCSIGRNESHLVRPIHMNLFHRIPGRAWGSKHNMRVWSRYARIVGAEHIHKHYALDAYFNF